MDGLAKSIALWKINSKHKLTFHPTDLGFGTVACEGTLVGSKLQQSLYYTILHSESVARLAILLNKTTFLLHQTVHWHVLTKARKEARLSTNICLSKWIRGDTATGKVMVQRKKRLLSNCPICNLPDEDTTHVLKCQAEQTISLRQNLLNEFQC